MLQRFKGIFSRRGSQIPSNDRTPPSSQNTIRKQYHTDEEDDNESVGAYNVQEQSRLRGKPRSNLQSDNSAGSEGPYDRRPPSPRTPLAIPNITNNGFRPGQPPNNNINNNPANISNNRPQNSTMGSTNFPASQPGLPFLAQIQNPSAQAPLRPAVNPATNVGPPPLPSVPPFANTAQPRFPGAPPFANTTPPPYPGAPPFANTAQPRFPGAPPFTNTAQSPFPRAPPPANISQALLSGVPPAAVNRLTPPPPPANALQINLSPSGDTSNPQQQNLQDFYQRRGFTGDQRGPMSSLQSSFRQNSTVDGDTRTSRLELDYPIEEVLIDANIPQTVALKVNEAVERDRLGKAYHVSRYTFEPLTQHITIGNNQHIDRRFIPPHHHHHQRSHQGGVRHIREVLDGDQQPPNRISPFPGSNHPLHRALSISSSNRNLDRVSPLLGDSSHNLPRTSPYPGSNHPLHRASAFSSTNNPPLNENYFKPIGQHHTTDYHSQELSQAQLDQWLNQIIQTPGTIVLHPKDMTELQQILTPQIPPTIISTLNNPYPFELTNGHLEENSFLQPVTYLTARALPNDPMRS